MKISLDLETYGTTPGSDLRSIGACVIGGTPDQTFYVATDNPTGYWHSRNRDIWVNAPGRGRRYGLKRDPRTVQWWSEQSDEAQAAFADPVDLRVALGRFTQWLMTVAPACGPSIAYDITIWSHGAAFDPPILAAAYEAVGLPVPWHYRAPRDTRTLFDVAGITDHSAWLAQHPGPLGVPHHALDDAICQARAVCAAMTLIRPTAP